MARRRLPALHPAGVLLGAVLTGLGVLAAEAFIGPFLGSFLAPKEERIMGMVHDHLAESYVEPRDRQWLMHRAIEGMLDGLEDPYTFFVGPEDLIGLEEDSSGNLIGIGVTLDGNVPRVRFPQPGGPAEESGLQPGDRITAVDGQDVSELSTSEVVPLIKGPVGTSVHLALERYDADPFEVDIVRRPVPKGTVAKVEMIDPERGIGLVHIRSFARSTPAELDVAIARLQEQGLEALVLDLRFNIGGLLDAAVAVAGRFLEGGVVCRLVERRSNGEAVARVADPEDVLAADIPLVVLINSLSASGSEVLAGALRDRGAATLAGSSPSFGKGVFQQVHRYRTANFALKFTAGYYVTPAGRILEGHIDPERASGLDPDLHVPVPIDEARDLQGWLLYDEPPERYRELVHRIFPNVAEITRPPDAVLDAATAHLRAVLES